MHCGKLTGKTAAARVYRYLLEDFACTPAQAKRHPPPALGRSAMEIITGCNVTCPATRISEVRHHPKLPPGLTMHSEWARKPYMRRCYYWIEGSAKAIAKARKDAGI